MKGQSAKCLGIGLALLVLLASCVLNARADDTPPVRSARLSYLQGNVTVDHLDNTAGDPAQINMPLVEGSRLTTGEDGQAEVEFEDGSVVRITPNSSVGLNLLSVDASGSFHTQLAILHGLVYAELRAAAKFTYSLNADGELISPSTNATIRINLDQPPAIVSVFDGTVHVEHPSSAETDGYKTDVHAGEALTGDASDSGRFFQLQSVEADSWDEWNQGRDQAAAEAAASRTTARDGYAEDQGYGWADLDANGSWYDLPSEGQVWQPSVAVDADFDPYGYGSWVAYSGTGYVWASGYPWGWTPFRCGSWSYWNSFGWGWSPGAGCGRGIYAINVHHPPVNYHAPTRPGYPSGVLHPIPVGHAPSQPGTGLRQSQELRLIAGVPVRPLPPIGNPTTTKSRSVTGAALRNDFAVDHTSRQPVAGVASAAPSATPHGDFRAVPSTPVAPPLATIGVEQPARPMRPEPPPTQRPYYPAPAQSTTPRPPPTGYSPRSAPPPSSPPAPRAAPSAPAPAAPRK